MSFSSDVKKNLCEIMPESRCCERALLYGMLFFSRRFSGRGIELSATSFCVAELAARLCDCVAGVAVSVIPSGSGGGVLRITGKENVSKLLAAFGHTPGEVSYSLNYGNLENDCCVSSFLRGAFLSCGRMTDPARGYRLEFSVIRMKAGGALETLLQNAGYPPLTSFRSNSRVLYYKDSETIEELLTDIGAVGGALEVMNAKVYKDLRNRVNRLTNCEAANIGKTVKAAKAQLDAIRLIRERGGGIGELPEELRQIARLRVNHPDASLSEIGALCEPPISRSGVNHRMERILEIAARISKQK